MRSLRPIRPLVVIALASLAGTAIAATKTESEVAAPPVGAASAAPTHGLHEMRDPLDVVRERLAARLGAIRAPNTPNPNVLRVTSQGAASGAPAGGASDATDAAASRTPTAQAVPITVHHAAAAASDARAHMTGRTTDRMTDRTTDRKTGKGHWDYGDADGPAHWAASSRDASACASGARQSPIDLHDGIKVDLEPVQFDYKPSTFSVVDTGHTVQVDVAAGNAIQVMGRRFELVEFHFHRPSEERVDGKPFEMVAHLVHKDAAGRLAILAVLLERGSAQPTVQSVWNNLPLEKGEALRAEGTIDLNTLLPADRRYFTYMGSLTTPPCTEGVLWMVMKTPVSISDQQLDIFARLYPMNARPIQPTRGRMIKESN